MPPSQLKRLKASLREQGITGAQKSKKQKKTQKSNPKHSQDRRATLQQIRDTFNPFELRPGSARPAKFESASSKPNPSYKDVLHRPGAAKSVGEEMRKRELLPELQRRNKVGGLVDRRIGEGDAGLTPEERAIQRFAREKERKRGGGLFDLEASDEDEPKVGLTHHGKSLDELRGDDFVDDISGGDESGSEGEVTSRKRQRSDEEGADGFSGDEVAAEEPERKKTKKEVMEEVIAKSKLHKYERQKAKEDDDDLREELDKGMADMLALLRGHKQQPKNDEPEAEAVPNGDGPKIDPERQKLLDGMDRERADKDYEVRLRQLRQDARAQPSDRTKTEEEKVKEDVERLKELEEKRMKRMRGEDVSEEEDDGNEAPRSTDVFGNEEEPDEAAEFGFTLPNAMSNHAAEDKVVHEDEDEFDFDEDLVASGSEASDVDVSERSDESSSELDAEGVRDQDEDDEFVKGILDTPVTVQEAGGARSAPSTGLAYTYPCPRSHSEFMNVLKDIDVRQIPTVVQRVRALHHPSLSASNKESMADFSAVLVDHISYMAIHKQPLPTIEQLIRHLHSLSRTYPTEIAQAFRRHLKAWHEREGGRLISGDLVILMAIGNIYPTSDHFHQVVTPAITLLAKWLGLNAPDTLEKRATGAFMVGLALSYQRLSRRYIPEAAQFTFKTLALRLTSEAESMQPHLDNLGAMADLWKDKTAFIEIFTPFLPLLKALGAKRELQHFVILLQQSRLRRRPLQLHNHRSLPIRSSIPKFEEGFNPDKHYDPDKERSDAKKLQKEYKRERKGALRELRKDANFIAREQLREKRERDAEYERKQRRLIAEIQGEEGHEAKVYEREKERRKRARM